MYCIHYMHYMYQLSTSMTGLRSGGFPVQNLCDMVWTHLVTGQTFSEAEASLVTIWSQTSSFSRVVLLRSSDSLSITSNSVFGSLMSLLVYTIITCNNTLNNNNDINNCPMYHVYPYVQWVYYPGLRAVDMHYNKIVQTCKFFIQLLVICGVGGHSG